MPVDGFRMDYDVEDLIAYCRENRRVCPQPVHWDQLWKLLPNRRHLGLGAWEPPAPMILAGWSAPALAKMLRLQEHIEWAEKHGALKAADEFLRNLPEGDWYHLGE
jgi:hypothetical protein